jgi:hypothetical protein
MRTGTTGREKGTRAETVLHVAFELDDFHWTLTMGTGMRREPRQRQIRPRDRSAILGEIQDTKRRFGLEAEVRIVTCYEAVREGRRSGLPALVEVIVGSGLGVGGIRL